MDRQEAISREEAVRTISRISGGSVSYAEDLYDSFFPKPVVPQYVSDWYEANKVGFQFNLIDWIKSIPLGIDDKGVTEFDEWLLDDDNKPIQTLVDMHRLGYEVKKEPRYTVRLKGLTSKRSYLNYLIDDDRWYLNDEVSSVAARTHHTRKELKEGGFEWVFDCQGVEVKEVE